MPGPGALIYTNPTGDFSGASYDAAQAKLKIAGRVRMPLAPAIDHDGKSYERVQLPCEQYYG